jgi:hypothetical protein
MPNRGDLSSAISELETLVLATHHSLAQGPLEEVAIEAMLIKLWSQDQLKNVGGRTPSTWYLKDNAKKVMTLNQFEDVISTLKKDAETNFWPEIADQADKALDRMLAPRTEALRIAEEAEAQIAKKTGSPSPVVGQLPPISAPPDTGAGEPAPAGSTTGGTKTPAVEEQVVSESGIRSNAGIKWSDHESHQGCGRNYNLQTLEASARSIHDFVLGKK